VVSLLDGWFVLNGTGGAFLAIVAVVGLCSLLVSPAYLSQTRLGLFPEARAGSRYYLSFCLFWAALLILPLVGNLAIAWLLIEVTTGASAVLIAASGRPTALEAAWKYLVLTTFGLAISLLGILVLFTGLAPHGGSLHVLDWDQIARHIRSMPRSRALLAFVLLVGGMAAKIGWAPVHNWLPDAHSEAPPPVSALLSAALLPTVILVVWRSLTAIGPGLAGGAGNDLLIAFGLVSLAISVPFLWRPLPWKRLLAYSSLEHMGVIALGIGFGTRLAIAGVFVHLAGHAFAKALGFYVASPLQALQADSGTCPPRGIAEVSPRLASAMALSLGTLAGVPPLPLFVSEVMILFGGFESGRTAVSAVAAVLLALAFLGLAHALIEGLLGQEEVHGEQVVA
jgi:hydrogenase-4 component F